MAMADGSIFDEEFKSESTIHKRKSLVFHTRFSVARDHDKDVNDEVITNGNRFASNKDEETCNTKNDIEAFNLKEYIEKLKQERKDWQQEYRKRKTQRRNLIKQKISMEEQGQILDINVLTETERTFVLTRPNYEHICKNSKKLQDVALRISTLSQNVHKLNRRFMERMESNIAKATVQVIKISEQ
ncbi:uncharacterized protein LOC105833687 isoform X1 [Monomorium pharaonis]|uniref:uncharacterized protein LOC105833687 isoform X1 n=1 Tax=Monomorium pharaonis TaxID=307658 RepID=UPI00063F76E3|nr:uncharacterized protein LOC105833687 isoform X1 [Monomorium pharaonis]XP_036142409.1 uncharacterized protein LOC105833687 isoform X1 [Monomorium pharaonis]